MKRREDSFPYFALRYLELGDKLKNIRFQIYLGKVELANYEKKDLNIERRVLTEIHSFGRLSDFIGKQEEILSELNKDIIDSGNSVKWDQFKPSYAIEMNRIGFYLFDGTGSEEEANFVKYPICFINTNEDKKVHIKVNKISPTGFISTHMLPKLVMSYLVGDKSRNGVILINEFLKDLNPSILDIEFIEAAKKELELVLNPEQFTKRNTNLNAIKKIRNITRESEEGLKQYKIVEHHFINNNDVKHLLGKVKMDYNTLMDLSKEQFIEKTKSLTINDKEFETFNYLKYQYHLTKRRQALNTVIKSFFQEIKTTDLPVKLYNYLLNINNVDHGKTVHKRMQEEVAITKRLIKEGEHLKKYDNKVKLGELATIIARDIINMIISKDVKSKMTNPFANRLQNLIAYFSVNKQEIIDLCHDYEVFNGYKGHVFLTRGMIQQSTGVIDFYLNYLREKLDWIDNTILIKGKNGGYVLRDRKIPYTYKKFNDKAEEYSFNKWLQEKQKSPVNLPVTLLDEDLTNALKSKLKLKPDLKDGFSKLIQLYLRDDAQEFYSFDRVYRNNEKEHVLKYSNEGSSKEMQLKYGKKAVESEKIIRHVLLKDRILRVICEDLLKSDKNTSSTKSFLLKDISPWSETNILNKSNEFSYNLRKNIDGSGTEYCTIVAKDSTEQVRQINEWNALSKEIKSKFLKLNAEQKIDFLKTQDEKTKLVLLGQQNYQWKFSDFGRFRRFMKDKRINEMVKYFEPRKIPFDLLEFQILQYNINREKMFDKIFELERIMAERYFEEIKSKHLENFKYNEVGFQTYLNVLSEKIASGYDKDILKWGRNKFSHTEIVYYKSITKIIVKDIEEFELKKHVESYKENVAFNIARNIYRVFCEEVDKTIHLINKSFKV